LFSSRSKFVAVILILLSNDCFSHEEGGNYSGAIIDPLRVHHAHIENEQKIDFSLIYGIDNLDGNNGFSHSLELALKWDDNFLWGSEIFIPYSDVGGSGAGIDDIEVQLIKHAFINEPETILTGSFGMSLPTGNKSKGLGGENTAIKAALFLDKAAKNWYWGLNLGLDTIVSGENDRVYLLQIGTHKNWGKIFN